MSTAQNRRPFDTIPDAVLGQPALRQTATGGRRQMPKSGVRSVNPPSEPPAGQVVAGNLYSNSSSISRPARQKEREVYRFALADTAQERLSSKEIKHLSSKIAVIPYAVLLCSILLAAGPAPHHRPHRAPETSIVVDDYVTPSQPSRNRKKRLCHFPRPTMKSTY